MTEPVEGSYAYCRAVARSRARNFYYSFVLLPEAQRKAMCAMYAFMRYCDDLSDEPGEREAARDGIARWRADLDAALAGGSPAHPVWPAFQDAVERYRIPHEYFYEMIAGVGSDLEPRQMGTFDELYRYCYQVASVVGLTIVHIFGFESAEALPLAEKCGVAFQLTNILRDVKEDAERGRVYLPAEDMVRFGVSAAELDGTRAGAGFFDLMRFEGARARRYYEESKPLVGMVSASSRRSLWALIEIYSTLLERLEQAGYDVLSRRINLGVRDKGWIVARAALGVGVR